MDTLSNVVKALAAAGADPSLVGKTLLELVGTSPDAAQAPVAAPPSSTGEPSRTFKMVVFTDAIGHRSNVGIPYELFHRATLHFGTEKAATRFIRGKALEAPPAVRNRSGWVQDRLVRELTSPEARLL